MTITARHQKALGHLLALLPFLWLLWQGGSLYNAQDNALTANPIKYIHHFTGNWAIRFILLGLAITPLRQIFGWRQVIKFRRMIGLYAFFYVTLHLVNFIVLDYFFDWKTIAGEIIKRPAITLGMTAALLLVPLAITSTRGWVRRLGRGWLKLHKLVYLIAVLAVIHNIMMVKADLQIPMVHLAILVVLLGYRLPGKFPRKIREKYFKPYAARRRRLSPIPISPKPSRARDAGSGTGAETAE